METKSGCMPVFTCARRSRHASGVGEAGVANSGAACAPPRQRPLKRSGPGVLWRSGCGWRMHNWTEIRRNSQFRQSWATRILSASKRRSSMAVAAQPLAPAPAPAPTPAPHPLREPNFRKLWIGSAISLFGDQFYLVALPWVVLQLTGSAVAMGTILMSASIPRLALMLLGGAMTDRFSPRKIYMGTATARTVFVAAIGFLLWFHQLHIWELYVLGFGFGVADAFSLPAASTLLPSLVKREQMVAATSVFQTTAQLTTIVGPTPAALVIKTLGTAWAFFLDA